MADKTKAPAFPVHPAPPTPEQIEALRVATPTPAPVQGIEAAPPVDGAAPPPDVDQNAPAATTRARDK